MNRVWAPQWGSQRDFVTCPVYEALYEGTRGPGKTNALLFTFAQYCGQGFGAHWRGVLFRQTYPQLADIVAKTKEWFFPTFPGIKFNASDYVWKWPTGEELLLRHMARPDDYWNYHGHEYPWIGFEELTNWPTLECYESMKSCSRSSHEGMPRLYRSTCNPYGVGHNAVKTYFQIDSVPAGQVIREPNRPPRVRIHGHVSENTALMRADPDYIQKLASITNINKREAWLNGSWDITAGGMFDDIWERPKHVIKPFPIPADWRIDRSFDWGSARPFSVGWWARASGSDVILADGTRRAYPRGSLFRIGEYYGWNGKANEGLYMLSTKIAQEIVRREALMGIAQRVKPGPADSSIFDTTDGKSIADEMRIVGVTWEPAVKNPGSRVNGWEKMRAMMQNTVDREGPGFYVFDTCKDGFLRTVPSIPRDEDDLDDVDTDAEDHVADECRYRVLHEERTVAQKGMY